MKKGRPAGAAARTLRTALRNEVEGREFYAMAARSARRDATRQMFAFLEQEERRHCEEIVAQIARLAEGKAPKLLRPSASREGIRKFRSALFPPGFAADARKAEAEVAALSIGMTLERRAIAHYAALRTRLAGDPAARKVLDRLIAWEKDHLDVLSRQYEQLREMFWEEARFWPF